MPEFRVTIYETIDWIYTVTADSEEEALKMVETVDPTERVVAERTRVEKLHVKTA